MGCSQSPLQQSLSEVHGKRTGIQTEVGELLVVEELVVDVFLAVPDVVLVVVVVVDVFLAVLDVVLVVVVVVFGFPGWHLTWSVPLIG